MYGDKAISDAAGRTGQIRPARAATEQKAAETHADATMSERRAS
jgi:hypothetical protein